MAGPRAPQPRPDSPLSAAPGSRWRRAVLRNRRHNRRTSIVLERRGEGEAGPAALRTTTRRGEEMRALRVLTVTGLLATLALAAPAVSAATPIPTHVYSPYFETWTTDSLTTIAQQSGARYFTM